MITNKEIGYRALDGLRTLRALRDGALLQMHLLRMEARDRVAPRIDRARGEIAAARGRLRCELRRLRDLWPRRVD